MEETECIYGTNSKNYVFLVLLCIYVFFCLGMGKLPEAGGGGTPLHGTYRYVRPKG